jgi:glutamate racemase
VMGRDVVLVSSAEETAFEVRAGLGALARADGAATRAHEFVTSGDVDQFLVLGARFLGPEVRRVEAWRW